MTDCHTTNRPHDAVSGLARALIVTLCLALPACAGNETGADTAALTVESGTAGESAELRKQPQAVAAKETRLVEIQKDQIRKPFTKETVIKLNAIVRRSLDTVREYDRSIDGIRDSVQAGAADDASAEVRQEAKQAYARLESMSARTTSALDDMTAAVEELKASDEFYNEEILAGMVQFVTKVEAEISEEEAKAAGQIAALD